MRLFQWREIGPLEVLDERQLQLVAIGELSDHRRDPFKAGLLAETAENNGITRLLSKVRTIAAFSYKKSIGQPLISDS